MRTAAGSLVLWLCLGPCLVASAAPVEPGEQSRDRLVATWARLRRAEAGSQQADWVRSDLAAMMERVPVGRRVESATALMDRYAPDNINAAATRLFGPDPFPPAEIREVLFDSKRSPAERVLIRTYYGLCRHRDRDRQLSEKACIELLELLRDRLDVLTGKKVGYGEQRLLVHLCQSMLTRYAAEAARLPQAGQLVEATRQYAQAADEKDAFAAAATGWLRLIEDPVRDLTIAEDAVATLGHWDGLSRLEASAYLARATARHPEVAGMLWQLLDDRRDEVRAAAAIAFAHTDGSDPDKLTDRMVKMLLIDRGVVPQAAASAALAARADQAGAAISPLIDAFTPAPGKRLPKPKRAGGILSALAALAGQATTIQRDAMLSLALQKLPVAPGGALKLLKGLGPSARPALPQIREYRAEAGRFDRQYIDRHVLPAIKFGKAQ